MRKSRSSISRATSYKEIGEFWDTHDLSDFWDKTKKVSFEVDIRHMDSFLDGFLVSLILLFF